MNKKSKKFYITTAIPYVNARPHLGHALEFVQADVLRRFHMRRGEDALLLSGSDDNALKNVQAAEAAGVPVQQFVDQNGKLFAELAAALPGSAGSGTFSSETAGKPLRTDSQEYGSSPVRTQSSLDHVPGSAAVHG